MSTTVTVLAQPIAVTTPLGPGYAILIETGPDDQFWTIALDNCAIVTFEQRRIRIARSYTYGRSISDEEMQNIITVRPPK